MNININTKFNVGDHVYKSYYYDGETFVSAVPYTVCRIVLKVESNVNIFYELVEDMGLWPESILFSTYEECKQIVNDYKST